MTVKTEREELKKLLEATKKLLNPLKREEKKEGQGATTQKGRS